MAEASERKRGLGRGLSALMADVTETENKGSGSAEQRILNSHGSVLPKLISLIWLIL